MSAPAEARTLREGRYVLLATLGEGAQGQTWDAVDKREGRPVAIKRFDVRGARAWKDVELAEREARVLAALEHPKLPRYVEHFEEDGVLYLVMEKIEGTPLSKLRKQGPMSERDVERLLRDADDVLAYLHGRAPAVIHRDLKPSNVIRRPDGSFAFVDFGAVRDRMRPEGGSTVVGTFGYMAPEQFQGRAGPGSDVYAIGATALAMLTGEEPESLPHKGLAIDVEGALRGRASPAMARALTAMLEPNPDARPTRIGPLLEAASSARGDDRRASARGARFDDAPFQDVGARIRAEVHARIRDEIEARLDEQHLSRKQRRRLRRERRREDRHRRRAERAMGVWRPPWFVLLAVGMGLLVAQLAVLFAVRLAVPFVLIVLSVVFGRSLRDAAQRVADAADRAGNAIHRARTQLQDGFVRVGDATHAEDGRVRVEPSPSGEPEVRARVGDADEVPDDEALESERAGRRGA